MKSVTPDVHFPTLEKNILKLWDEKGIIKKGLEANQGKKPFVFYDGPPFATGLPHYGHILPGTLKDIVPRYWVMKGRYVQRRWGWDCHGLPVEYEMEKELGLKGLHDIEKLGIAKFNESCRQIVLRYTAEWERMIQRTGRWVDFENAYRTMDPSFMESVWWVFKQLWEQGLIYEGYRVMPYSWRISTPLSNFEANLNYKEVQDPALTVRFKSENKARWLLAWTTTPWTLPSNLALAVHEDIDYVEVLDKASNELYVLAEARLSKLYKSESDYEVKAQFKGKALEGENYQPLFPYFSDKKQQGAFKVVLGHHVTTEEGTGIVHMAPAFGEDDFLVCERNQIPIVNPVGADGNFLGEVADYAGQNVKEADKQIIKDLKQRGNVVLHDTIVHNYPFCWRSETPLIYRAISTWFVKLDPIKETLLESNKKTHWVPEHLRDGRFGKWLDNARDWNISRNRFWGTPLPVWRCEETGEVECMGSIQELEERSGKKITDLHKHFIDDVTIPHKKTGKTMRRIPEVLDCWFESGSMPYGQAHYPFENKESFEQGFPADFIAEGLDQTRGWFYTLSVLGNALFKKAPFKNVIVNGLILAEDGKKMSKRLKNYPPLDEVLDKYGADALRAYLTVSPAARAEELRFSESGIKDIIRSVMLPLWNAYSFFTTYACADGWKLSQYQPNTLNQLENDLDRWIVSRLQTLIQRVEEKMEIYHLYEVIPPVLGFIDELTNWYIRLNRRRFWKEEKGSDKEAAYQTLYFVLSEFSKVLAPILPFITEAIHQNLKLKEAPESVHLASFPSVNESWRDSELESQMDLVETVIVMGRSLRNTHKIKTRQPLPEIHIISKRPELAKSIEKFQSIIQAELNVKAIQHGTDETKYVDFSAKPNAKLLGPRLGKKMKAISQQIRALSHETLTQLEKEGSLVIERETIQAKEVLLDRVPKQEGLVQSTDGVTILLNAQLSDALIAEGQAREIVNRIQKLRKDMGLEVSDRISLRYACDAALTKVLETHKNYIMTETLAENLAETKDTLQWSSKQNVDGIALNLHLEKSSA